MKSITININKIYLFISIVFTISLFLLGSILIRGDYKPLNKSYTYYIFFERGTSEDLIKKIRQEIEKNPNVFSTKYVSETQAYEDYKEELLLSNNYQILKVLESFEDKSIIASINIKLSNYSDMDDLEKFLREIEAENDKIKQLQPNIALKKNYSPPKGLRKFEIFKILGKQLNNI